MNKQKGTQATQQVQEPLYGTCCDPLAIALSIIVLLLMPLGFWPFIIGLNVDPNGVPHPGWMMLLGLGILALLAGVRYLVEYCVCKSMQNG